jgi:hypothetical protein
MLSPVYSELGATLTEMESAFVDADAQSVLYARQEAWKTAPFHEPRPHLPDDDCIPP